MEALRPVYRAGETGIEVTVYLKNNPGILGADFAISFDSELSLVGAVNGVTADDVTYTKPKIFKNPTTFLWDSQDLTWTEDGVILTLLFNVSASAAPGEYDITLTYEPGYIFDVDFEAIDFTVVNAVVKVG